MAEKVTKPTGSPRKKSGGARWVVLGVLALAIAIAVEAGYAGFGLAHVRAAVFPRDEALLGYVPGDLPAVVILDPHQIDPKALGGEGSVARSWLTRTRKDIDKATGIDLLFEVDKLVLAPTIVVARGRFDEKEIASKLAEASYASAEHDGHRYLVRSGEDALAVVDGEILLYGDEDAIKAAFDAKKAGTSLEHNEALIERLRRVGWNHGVVASVRVAGDKPSIRSILTGSTGPRAVSGSIATKLGLDGDVEIEAATPAAAEELRKLLDEKRADAAAINGAVGSEAGAALLDVAKKATITADPGQSFVRIHLHVEPAQLDALGRTLDKAGPLGEVYKNFRLFQLLAPLG